MGCGTQLLGHLKVAATHYELKTKN